MHGWVEESEEKKADRKLRDAARAYSAGVLNSFGPSEALVERLQDAAIVYANAYFDAHAPKRAKRSPRAKEKTK